jgi:hypothetical protein
MDQLYIVLILTTSPCDSFGCHLKGSMLSWTWAIVLLSTKPDDFQGVYFPNTEVLSLL